MGPLQLHPEISTQTINCRDVKFHNLVMGFGHGTCRRSCMLAVAGKSMLSTYGALCKNHKLLDMGLDTLLAIAAAFIILTSR